MSVTVFLLTATYARKETVVGVLAPGNGSARVSAPRSATVSAVHVREGQRVERGAPLITLSSNPTLADGRRLGDVFATSSEAQRVALARQAQARQLLIQRQRDEIAVRREGLIAQRQRLLGDLVLQQQRVGLAEQTLEAANQLQQQGLMSTLQYRQRQESMLVAKLSLSSMQQELQGIPVSLSQLAAQDQRLLAEAEDAAATIASSAAELSQRDATNKTDTELVLTASTAGTVAALQAVQGGSVNAGSTLALVVPSGAKLQAQLWLPSRAAGFVRIGDRVRLMYDAFPYQRFGVGKGRVVDLARAPVAPTELPAMLKAEEDLYRVLVELDDQQVNAYGSRWALSPGMRLQADLVLEKQSLWDWLFDAVRATRVRAQPV
ncbi:HlyD family secretion protein [Caulobacter endophyticus]|uniref:HlyD family secretion protein n=1 Tax=Caulobacter endophyticus TaxID=2172652 RepID=UPI00241048FE|nr:HlyD family efflux transporter periplasmic adaptor subunit [Caulobacter endophyticus]MDG2528910.1 HlyD family efflux transporter periplasmic adaptor subunit [Caulobacter endophyticus]